jgi:hypothetical protein
VLPREAALADDELAGFRILVLPGCEAALTPEEVGAIRRFAGAGGSVLVAGPDAAGAAGGDALAGLLAPYGMSIGPPGTGAGEHTPCAHAITEDMGGSVACGSVVATVAGGVPFLLSAAGPTAVAGEHASGGRAVLLGDASLLLETALEPNREELLLNLLGWLSRSASEWHGELQPGWNLVSVPLFPLDPGTTAVLAGLAVPARRAFGWSQARGTTALQCLLPGDAFWVYLGDDGRESAGTAVPWDVRGDPSRRTTVRLRAGWNLVGPLHGGAIPAGLGVLAVWAWDPGANAYEFILPDTPLQPGRGYWVFSTRACDVAW